MGKAQKLKQQRKEELEQKQQEERKKVWRRVFIIVVSLLTVAVTVGLVLLVNQLKENEQQAQETSDDEYQQELQEAAALDASVPTVPDEIGVSNLRGGVGMAKPSDQETQLPLADSAQNEFYILKVDTTSLDQYFTIFGQVTEGMEIVDSLTTEDYLVTAEIRDMEGEVPAKEWVLNTSKGTIVIRLLSEETPLTTQHIIDLTNQGFYNDLRWYRVEEFVVQTGSHTLSLQTSTEGQIPIEETPTGSQ